jgi:hypothetical protein
VKIAGAKVVISEVIRNDIDVSAGKPDPNCTRLMTEVELAE